jgi:uncharacterized protein (DUF427 family)
MKAGQRSVWDFPRPPAIENVPSEVRVELGGVEIARSTRCVRVLETSHPPVYFFPPEDVRTDLLKPTGRTSACEWKGRALYFDVVTDSGATTREVAFTYPEPTKRFEEYAGWLSFYADELACYVGEERVTPQPGLFYSGWVTSEFAGPFKGGPGSWGW